MDSKNIKLLFLKTTKNHQQLYNRFKNSHDDSFSSDVIDLNSLFICFCKKKLSFFPFTDKFSERLINYFLYFFHYLFAKSFYKYCNQLLTKKYGNVDAFIFCDHYITFLFGIFVKLANSLDIHKICVPYVCQDIDDIKLSRFNHKGVRKFSYGLLASIVKFKYKSWFFHFKDKAVFWAAPFDIFALRNLGFNVEEISPRKGLGDFVDVFYLPNKIAKNRFVKGYGIDEKKIKIVGDIAFDEIHRNLTNEQDVFLVSICPDLKKETCYGSYINYIYEYIALILDIRKVSKIKVVTVFHPSVKEEVKEAFSHNDIEVYDDDISKIIGKASIYLTSYSSTILWGDHIGVYCLDHDIYNIGYCGNKKLENTKLVRFDDNLSQIVLEIISRKGMRTQKNSVEYLDGNVRLRIISSIKELKSGT
ncbi:hypothetical protein [Idiomarina loihiensis]|uniref:hypothetical protein n=1 Tax=Idiomarina loihiensis TaxID=135577 RepID=UPI00315828E1